MTAITRRVGLGRNLTAAEVDANFDTKATTDVFSASAAGLVPASGSATGATFLADNGTFVTPAGAGDVLLSGVQTITGTKTFGSIGATGKLVLAGFTSGSTVLDASPVATGVLTLPAAIDTLVGRSTTDTLVNKTLTSPTINSPTMTNPTLGTVASGNIATCVGLTVPGGGTGRATSTTAYGLIAAGTTATGAQQTLAAGLTTEILVGGGTGALPSWSTATGSGAPVRGTSPSITAPTLTGAVGGTATLPATVTMASTPSQADNSTRIATTSYVDTLGATKVSIVSAVSLTGANTLVQATHFNRHLSWTGAVTAAQALSPTATAGDFVEVTNDGSVPITFTGGSAATGFKFAADPNETFQCVYTNGAWKSFTPVRYEVLMIPVGDETTALTPGTGKITWRMPYAMTVTGVRASVGTASSSGLPTVDINEEGVSILSTKLSIDANEKTSTTAATAAVISDTALADDAEMTIDIDVSGTNAAGLKVYISGYRA